ncbi:MAG: hypothetical protein DRK00_03005 [Thermoprotei archaeon]|nr:MAG: hypothetical protein DRK00_03005 [Thermoprotei archaeon]
MLRGVVLFLKISLTIILLLRLLVRALSLFAYCFSLRLRVGLETLKFRFTCRRYVGGNRVNELCRIYSTGLEEIIKTLTPLNLISYLNLLRKTHSSMSVSSEDR